MPAAGRIEGGAVGSAASRDPVRPPRAEPPTQCGGWDSFCSVPVPRLLGKAFSIERLVWLQRLEN